MVVLVTSARDDPFRLVHHNLTHNTTPASVCPDRRAKLMTACFFALTTLSIDWINAPTGQQDKRYGLGAEGKADDRPDFRVRTANHAL